MYKFKPESIQEFCLQLRVLVENLLQLVDRTLLLFGISFTFRFLQVLVDLLFCVLGVWREDRTAALTGFRELVTTRWTNIRCQR